jgi:hypothetical protein
MTFRRKWAAVPGVIAIVALATALSAYRGASFLRAAPQSPQTPQTPQQPAAGSPSTATPATGDAIDTLAPTGPWGYSAASSDQGYQPAQPINFPHPRHVQTLGMNCLYCHFSANKSPDPGMPALSTCMGCHNLIGPNLPARLGHPAKTPSPDLANMARLWAAKKPVAWVRIHRVPRYVHFPHMRHVNAGVTCQTCHGQVQKMNRVFQYASLNMGWCVNCHVNGYDPAEGMRAAGFAAPGAAPAPKTADASHGGGGSGISLVREANAQTREANPQISDVPGGNSLVGQRKRARYDCAVCHY